jgi:hypothetical protein
LWHFGNDADLAFTTEKASVVQPKPNAMMPRGARRKAGRKHRRAKTAPNPSPVGRETDNEGGDGNGYAFANGVVETVVVSDVGAASAVRDITGKAVDGSHANQLPDLRNHRQQNNTSGIIGSGGGTGSGPNGSVGSGVGGSGGGDDGDGGSSEVVALPAIGGGSQSSKGRKASAGGPPLQVTFGSSKTLRVKHVLFRCSIQTLFHAVFDSAISSRAV